jgi:hypothetical protein
MRVKRKWITLIAVLMLSGLATAWHLAHASPGPPPPPPPAPFPLTVTVTVEIPTIYFPVGVPVTLANLTGTVVTPPPPIAPDGSAVSGPVWTWTVTPLIGSGYSATMTGPLNVDPVNLGLDTTFTVPGECQVSIAITVTYTSASLTYTWVGGTTFVSPVFTAVEVTLPSPIYLKSGAVAFVGPTVAPESAASVVSFTTTNTDIATVAGSAPLLMVTGVEWGVTDLQAQIPGWTLTSAQVKVEGDAKPTYEIKLVDIETKGDETKIKGLIDLTDETRQFVVGQQIIFDLVAKNAKITQWEWKAEGRVFRHYVAQMGSDPNNEKEKVIQPEGKYYPTVKDQQYFVVCWMGTDIEEGKTEKKEKVSIKFKINGNKEWEAKEAEAFVIVHRPKVSLTPAFGKTFFFEADQKDPKDGKLFEMGLFKKVEIIRKGETEMINVEKPGLRIDITSVSVPERVKNETNIVGFVQLVKPNLKYINTDRKKTASLRSPYPPHASVNGEWCLDGNYPYSELAWEVLPTGKLAQVNPMKKEAPTALLDSPFVRLTSKWKDKDDPKKGLEMSELKDFGEILGAKMDHEFRSFFIYRPPPWRSGHNTFAVPIQVYSGWTVKGTMAWDGSRYLPVEKSLDATAGNLVLPNDGLLPEWTRRIVGPPLMLPD